MCAICAKAGRWRRAAAAPHDEGRGPAISRAGAAPPRSAADTPDEALRLLMEGNARYVADEPMERDYSAGRPSRALGQAPFASIIGCSDSRVLAEMVFDRGPGDLFIVRVAGNFVTEKGLGSLEFSAAMLGVKLIMVLGHTQCGAVDATVRSLLTGETYPGHIGHLVDAMAPGIRPVLAEPGEDLNQRAMIANVKYHVDMLRTAQPILAGMVERGELRVVGGVYDLATGRVELVD
ncbi:carbonic anhydrase [Roseococcus sp. SYP-B2431]|uniref:carbonic anhydrase n=1 Tax=Roseococcus sp. SYP-B2431 TaxID=2496640 RepID=UPI00103FE1BB|nr:carbonic anhydrase [Roseococcus sp. SYP-B2431]TCH96664.1 carbonic anhydrase [Roseococcus sp. SYP-B2431]